MEAWNDLYLELASTIKEKLPEVKWVDLWHGKDIPLTGELPFSTPAIFLSFKLLNCNDKGTQIQDCDTQIDMYLLYEKFNDTYQESYNNGTVLDFLQILTKIHKVFHGKSGANFGTLRRIGLERKKGGGARNIYRISFNCIIEDTSAKIDFIEKSIGEIEVEFSKFEDPKSIDVEPLFVANVE